MPTTLRAPSKAALRTLRDLAVGTSCTVVISAALLTAERRQRIHTAREVLDNAKRLKSSRQYHGSGAAVVEVFDDQVFRPGDDAFLLPRKVSKYRASTADVTGVAYTEATVEDSLAFLPLASVQGTRDKFASPRATRPTMEPYEAPHILLDSSQLSKTQLHDQQLKLASEINSLLEENLQTVDAAALRFFEAFEEELPSKNTALISQLVETAIKLSSACIQQSKFDYYERIFDIVNDHGPISEEEFNAFNPEKMIDLLIQSTTEPELERIRLSQAASIFLIGTKFEDRRATLSDGMQSLGVRLCRETCRFQMYDLTLDLYNRLNRCRGDGCLHALDQLITAAYGRGQHQRLYHYFQTLYRKTSPDNEGFNKICGIVIDSTLSTERVNRAEKVLVIAAEMAEANDFRLQTTWLLKVLGHEWRLNRNLPQTISLFERLEPFLQLTDSPQGLYSVIIQSCIEANDEEQARFYYDKMRESYEPSTRDVRIYGHFAFAKAMRKDWAAVKEDFRMMKISCPKNDKALSASFIPVLKLFAESHSVSETEEFLRYFLDELELKLTPMLMSFMIHTYAKANEIDSIGRWVEYATKIGGSFDAMSLNTLLTRCRKSFEFQYGEVKRFSQLVRARCPKLISPDTVSLLHRIAIWESKDKETSEQRIKRLPKRIRKSDTPLNSFEVYEAMTSTIKKGYPGTTLKIYHRARVDQLGPKHLLIAIKASLLLDGNNVDEPLSLIKAGQEHGWDVSIGMTALFVHIITASFQNGKIDHHHLTALARNIVKKFEERQLQFPLRAVTHATSVLQKRGFNGPCLQLWEFMSRHLRLLPSSLDLPSLTVILQAYLGLQDCAGIRRVVKMLSARNLVPDAHFRLLIKNKRRDTAELLKSEHDRRTELLQFHETLTEALEHTKIMREQWGARKKDLQSKTFKLIEAVIRGDKFKSKIAKKRSRETTKRESQGKSDGEFDVEF